ncbi:hypothetical protein K7432_000021 [Basidiobolus ranarum]|uniref:Inhibitor I9 domain-containing protein n=1 Tax=Basidiobolus ranarum TaxID=34480 RepID=A0ABR2WBW2_9FUNG
MRKVYLFALVTLFCTNSVFAYEQTTMSNLGNFIIELKDTAPTGYQELLENKVIENGGNIRSRFDTLLRGFSANMPSILAANFKSDEHISEVNEVRTAKLHNNFQNLHGGEL